MYGFLLSRRWLGFLLLVVVLGGVCVRLGIWQFDRLAQRRADNTRIQTYLTADPVPLQDVVSSEDPVAAADQWRRVRVTGTYDPRATVVVRFQVRSPTRGVDVVTPLTLEDGSTVLVDRGWMPGDAVTPEETPPPATGPVTVTGWLQPDSGAGTSATAPVAGQVRAISSGGIAPVLGRALLPGYVALTAQTPPDTGSLAPAVPPDLGEGPHFFYGLQWFFFAGLAGFGWLYFAWLEAHPRAATARNDQSARTIPPSTGSRAPVTNDAAGDSRNAAARANSTGSP